MIRSASFGLVVGLTVMVVASSPAEAKPRPPQVTGRTSVTIPPYGCQSAGKWMRPLYFDGTRVDQGWVTSVRKQGYTSPVSDAAVCGYMGSGTYTVRVKVQWSAAVRSWKRIPVYRYREVQQPTGETTPTQWETRDFPMTCALDGPATQNSEYRGGILMAYYDCASGGDVSIDFGQQDCCTVTIPNSDWTFNGMYYEQIFLASTRNDIPFGDVPQSLAGTGKADVVVGGGDPAYETGRHRSVHHQRQNRFVRWVRQPPVIADRVVQVTVR